MAEEEAQNLEFSPHPKFWPFLGRPVEDVLASSVSCFLVRSLSSLFLGVEGFKGSGVEVFWV